MYIIVERKNLNTNDVHDTYKIENFSNIFQKAVLFTVC